MTRGGFLLTRTRHANRSSDCSPEVALHGIRRRLAIRRHLLEHGPTSIRRLALAVGLRSTSTVHHHLVKLERAGLARRTPHGWEATT